MIEFDPQPVGETRLDERHANQGEHSSGDNGEEEFLDPA
jgi:hypothetical protein